MKALLQRVSQASVAVDGQPLAAIGQGLLVLLGVEPEDDAAAVDWMADKVLALRVFPGDGKAMNRSVTDVGGSVLVVSQFTLAADTSRGNRPGFSTAAAPDLAQRRYDEFCCALRARHPHIATGRFGADMQVALINDGPVTFLLER
ncbi:MAG: D-aminoacyl-tRNA deacylase [Pseudomonadales bacterium]